jgi:hypothetical protein
MLKSIYFVAHTFLLLQDYPRGKIELKINQIIKAITEQTVTISDGLFH